MNKIYVLPSIRVNNFKDASIKIKNYWNKYLALKLKNKITYAFYFNYSSNYKGDYDFTIGSENNFPNSDLILIEKISYKVFICNISTLIDTWKNIWNLENSGKLQRNYRIDFEKHYNDGRVEIYIS